MLLSSLGFPMETVLILIALLVIAMSIDVWWHRDGRVIALSSAWKWFGFWVAISVVFGGYVWWHHGREMGLLFFTGYALEQVLSLDNVFLMMAIFSWFDIPEHLHHRVLYWGMLGAMVSRLLLVGLGTGLLAWGGLGELLLALLIMASACLMLKNRQNKAKVHEQPENFSKHLACRWVRRFFPVFPKLYQNYFFLTDKTLRMACLKYPDVMWKIAGKNMLCSELLGKKLKKGIKVATPLLLCLAVIELSNLMLAFDSVPAVIAVSDEPLIVYSVMILAMLGLRKLYFILVYLQKYLVYLDRVMIILLFFVAFKLLFSASNHFWHHGWEISSMACLVVVLLVLMAGVLASVLLPNQRFKS